MYRNTLTLSEEAASRIHKVAELTGGSIPAYAARWAEEISLLPIEEQEALRDQVLKRITQLRAAGLVAAPTVPAVPPQLQAELATLSAQVSPPRPPARKRPSRPNKQTARAAKTWSLTA